MLIFSDNEFRTLYNLTAEEYNLHIINQREFISILDNKSQLLEEKLAKIGKFWQHKTHRFFYFPKGSNSSIRLDDWTPLMPKKELIPAKWIKAEEELFALKGFYKLDPISQQKLLASVQLQYVGGAYQKKDIDFEKMDKEFREELLLNKKIYEEESDKNPELAKLKIEILQELPSKTILLFVNPNYIVLEGEKIIKVHGSLKQDPQNYYKSFYPIYDTYIKNLDETSWILTAKYNGM